MHAIAWMNLENITLCERCKTQKAANHMAAFLCNVQNRQTRSERKQVVVTLPEAGRRKEWVQVSSWGNEKVLKLDSGDGCTSL